MVKSLHFTQSFHSISFAITVAIYIDVLFSVFGAQAEMIFKSRRHVNVDGFNVSDRDLTKGQTLREHSLPDLDAVGGFQVVLVARLDAEERVPVVEEARKAVHAVVGSGVFIVCLLANQFRVCFI